MADKYQGEVSKMLHSYNMFFRHEKPIPIVKGSRVVAWNSFDRASPDLVGGLVHQVNIEVKTANNGRFDFSSIEDSGQMDYARRNRIKRGCEFWFAIMFPVDRPVHGRLKRALYLVPFPVMDRTINLLKGIQKSIPWEYRKGMKLDIKERNLVASELWYDFKAIYNPEQKWYLPDGHAFCRMYLNKKPYLYTDAYEPE